MTDARASADAAAKEAQRALEADLVEMLAGETLRGLPDLGGGVRGLRVSEDASMTGPLRDSRLELVLLPTGRLRTIPPASSILEQPFGKYRSRRAAGQEPEVRASDFVPYVRAVEAALRLHAKSAGERAEKFRHLEWLARRLAEGLASERA